MKKNLTKKLVLKKHTLASLSKEAAANVFGGNADDSTGTGCGGNCQGDGGGGGGSGPTVMCSIRRPGDLCWVTVNGC